MDGSGRGSGARLPSRGRGVLPPPPPHPDSTVSRSTTRTPGAGASRSPEPPGGQARRSERLGEDPTSPGPCGPGSPQRPATAAPRPAGRDGPGHRDDRSPTPPSRLPPEAALPSPSRRLPVVAEPRAVRGDRELPGGDELHGRGARRDEWNQQARRRAAPDERETKRDGDERDVVEELWMPGARDAMPSAGPPIAPQRRRSVASACTRQARSRAATRSCRASSSGGRDRA